MRRCGVVVFGVWVGLKGLFFEWNVCGVCGWCVSGVWYLRF